MRVLPKIGEALAEELQLAWKEKHTEKNRMRLQTMRLVCAHELDAEQIAQVVGISRKADPTRTRRSTISRRCLSNSKPPLKLSLTLLAGNVEEPSKIHKNIIQSELRK